jgi:hypothetical protein
MKPKLPVGYVLLLTLLVGLNLSLVCQGHEHGDHITGPHLSFLGEPDEHGSPGESLDIETSHDMYGEAQAKTSAGDARQSCAVYSSSSALSAGSSWAKSSEPAESEPFILGFVMPTSLPDGAHAFRVERGWRSAWQSQAGVTPEPPPPRSI